MYFSEEPITNPAYAAAMRRLQEEKTPENQGHLLEEIAMRTRFILPITLSVPATRNEQGQLVVPKGTTAKVALLTGGDDKTYFAAFTCKEEWEKWKAYPNQHMAVAQFDDYVEMLKEDPNVAGVVIDAFGESYMLTRAEMERLRDVKAATTFTGKEEKLEPGAKVELHSPDNAEALIAAMSAYLERQPKAQAAYLRLMEQEDGQSYLVVLRCKEGFDKGVADGLARAALPHLQGMSLRVAPALSELGERVAMSTEAFYSAKK